MNPTGAIMTMMDELGATSVSVNFNELTESFFITATFSCEEADFYEVELASYSGPDEFGEAVERLKAASKKVLERMKAAQEQKEEVPAA